MKNPLHISYYSSFKFTHCIRYRYQFWVYCMCNVMHHGGRKIKWINLPCIVVSLSCLVPLQFFARFWAGNQNTTVVSCVWKLGRRRSLFAECTSVIKKRKKFVPFSSLLESCTVRRRRILHLEISSCWHVSFSQAWTRKKAFHFVTGICFRDSLLRKKRQQHRMISRSLRRSRLKSLPFRLFRPWSRPFPVGHGGPKPAAWGNWSRPLNPCPPIFSATLNARRFSRRTISSSFILNWNTGRPKKGRPVHFQ